MLNLEFSRRFGHYDYAAELNYLKSLPQTPQVMQKRYNLLYQLALRDIPYFAAHEQSRKDQGRYLNEYAHPSLSYCFDPNQLRVPAGSEGAGRWAPGGSSLLHDAQYVQPSKTPSRSLGRAGLAVQGAIQLYNYLTRQQQSNPNNGAPRAVIEFEHREYSPTGAEQALDLAFTRNLTRQETQIFCPRLEEVQSRVDRIDFETRLNSPDLSAQQHGTAVHVKLAYEINDQENPSFMAEKSILKTKEDQDFVPYGRADTVRIDVLERVDAQTVCVYDIKTGKAGLSMGRSAEIASEVFKAFGKLHQRIIVTEVRPKR